MLDVVVRKNCHAALGGQTAVDKRLPDAARSIPCILVGQLAPAAIRPALGDEGAFRGHVRPVIESRGELIRVLRQWLARPNDLDPVGSPLQLRLYPAEIHIADWRRHRSTATLRTQSPSWPAFPGRRAAGPWPRRSPARPLPSAPPS